MVTDPSVPSFKLAVASHAALWVDGKKLVGVATESTVQPGDGLAAFVVPANEKKNKITARTPIAATFVGKARKEATILFFFSLAGTNAASVLRFTFWRALKVVIYLALPLWLAFFAFFCLAGPYFFRAEASQLLRFALFLSFF